MRRPPIPTADRRRRASPIDHPYNLVPPPLDILHADDRCVVVNKPADLLVHRSTIDRHETAFLLQQLRDQIGRTIFPVHRLDRPTSGALLVALDLDACRSLSTAFENGAVSKRYAAIVRGRLPESGHIDHPLRRIDDDPGRMGGTADTAQDAVTDYRRIAEVELPVCVDRYPTSRYSLAELTPITGRRHQLRRHLKHLSHPIIGDTTYGKSRHNRLFAERFGSDRLLLACVQLGFPHPTSGMFTIVGAPLTGTFADVVDGLGWTDAARTAVGR